MAQASSGPSRFDPQSRCVFIAILTAMALLSGCDHSSAKSSPDSASEQQRPEKGTIIATVYPLADAARRVTGNSAQVEWIVERGQSLNSVEVTPDLRGRLNLADLVVTGGANEPWAVEGFDQPYRAPHILRLDLLPAAKNLGATSLLWLNPDVVKEAMRELVRRLALMHPRIAEDELRRNEQAFEAEIDGLLAEMRPRIDALPNKKVLALGSDFTALTKPMGLQEFSPTPTPATRLSDDDFRRIRETIRGEGLGTALVLDDVPQALVDDLSRRLGVQVLTIDSLGTSAPTGHNTYTKMLRYDLEQLARIR